MSTCAEGLGQGRGGEGRGGEWLGGGEGRGEGVAVVRGREWLEGRCFPVFIAERMPSSQGASPP